MSRVPLPSTFQLLYEALVEFSKALEGSRIINVNLSISLVKNPGLDVAPTMLNVKLDFT